MITMSRMYLIGILVLFVLYSSDANHIGHSHTKVSTAKLNNPIHANQPENNLNQDVPPTDIEDEEYSEDYFANIAAEKITSALEREPNTDVARNIIFIVADDVPISAFRQARKYAHKCEPKFGFRMHGLTADFQNVALARNRCLNTYDHDAACSTTSIATGVKTNAGTISISPEIGHCSDEPQDIENHKLPSFLALAQAAGKRTGVVTTSTLTNANVSPLYAHACNSAWESDADMPHQNASDKSIESMDIASQLITGETGRNLNLIMGGGRANFLPRNRGGNRRDNRHLIREYVRLKRASEAEFAYISDLDELNDVCIETDYVMALLSDEELDPEVDPSLSDLVEGAITMLDRPDNDGYVLFVQHANQAKRGIEETDEMDPQAQIQNTLALIEAAETAHRMTNEEDTLIVVTSNYVSRGRKSAGNKDDIRRTNEDLNPITSYSEVEFSYPSDLEDFPIVTPDECSIDDVGEDAFVLARGPWAQLYTGFIDQEWIPHFAGFAGCFGDGLTVCDL